MFETTGQSAVRVACFIFVYCYPDSQWVLIPEVYCTFRIAPEYLYLMFIYIYIAQGVGKWIAGNSSVQQNLNLIQGIRKEGDLFCNLSNFRYQS